MKKEKHKEKRKAGTLKGIINQLGESTSKNSSSEISFLRAKETFYSSKLIELPVQINSNYPQTIVTQRPQPIES